MKNHKICTLLTVSTLVALAIFTPSFSPRTYNLYAQSKPEPINYYLPLFSYNQHPLTSTSYYLPTVDESFLYNLGCELGTRDKNEAGTQDSVAILDFSYPVCNANGSFGVDLFGDNTAPVSTDAVESAVKSFAQGYYACSGTDVESNLVIGVGTNNKPLSCNTETKAADHGAAWATMVSKINQWALEERILHQVQAYGASDIELGWNTPTWTRAWIAGFEQVEGNFLLHFGDASGCPYEDNPHWSCGTSGFPQWTVEDVWFVSWGSPSALPLPLIYLTDGVHAKQWAYLSQYSVNQHGYRMDFTGVFTQSQYCQQFSWCNNTDNTPDQAYLQMETELSKDPATTQDLRWKTDIRWVFLDELSQANANSEPVQIKSEQHPVQKEVENLQAALQSPNLSSQMQSSLELKLSVYESFAQKIEVSKLNPAPKGSLIFTTASTRSSPEISTGIFTGNTIPALPYAASINNSWQSISDEGYLQVAAGASPDNPSRGALFIVQTSQDNTPLQSTILLAPEGTGPLTITGESANELLIQSENGSTFILDLQELSLTAN